MSLLAHGNVSWNESLRFFLSFPLDRQLVPSRRLSFSSSRRAPAMPCGGRTGTTGRRTRTGGVAMEGSLTVLVMMHLWLLTFLFGPRLHRHTHNNIYILYIIILYNIYISYILYIYYISLFIYCTLHNCIFTYWYIYIYTYDNQYLYVTKYWSLFYLGILLVISLSLSIYIYIIKCGFTSYGPPIHHLI